MRPERAKMEVTMPVKFISDPEEWERLTGSRGSVYIGAPPAKCTKPEPKRWGMVAMPTMLEDPNWRGVEDDDDRS